MLPDDRKRLQKVSLLLIQNLDVTFIIDDLLANFVLDDEDCERIEAEVTKKGKVRRLIKILRNLPADDVLDKFCKILRDHAGGNYVYFAEALKDADIREVEETVDEPDLNIDELRRQLIRQSVMILDMKEQHERELKAQAERLQSVATGTRSPGGLHTPWNLSDHVDGAHFKDEHLRAYVTQVISTSIPPPAEKLSQEMPFPHDLWRTGSPPTRPAVPGTLTIEEEACQIGVDIMRFVLVERGVGSGSSNDSLRQLTAERSATRVMRSYIEKVMHEHEAQFDMMVQQLDFTELDGYATFKVIADELFQDGLTGGDCNWGRVIVWYAFWAHVSRSFAIERAEETVKVYGNFVGFYIAKRLHTWLEGAGGWNGFVGYFIGPPQSQSWWSRLAGYLPWVRIFQYYPHQP